jgi:hypothetical protein
MKLGAHDDNMKDMANKKRGNIGGAWNRGENHGAAKFTWAQVDDMRAKYASGIGSGIIAKEYNVPTGYVSRIVLNKRWRRK